MEARTAYDELLRRLREETLLSSCADLLAWDEETTMPRAGAAHRGEQLALLAGMLHARATDPRLGDLLAVIEGSSLIDDPLSPLSVNVREVRRRYDRQVRLPRSLVEETARVTSLAQQEWALARQRADFRRFRPWLTKVLRLKRREAEALATSSNLYDALLDEYEPGATSEMLSLLFDTLRRELVPLVNKLTHATRQPDAAPLHRDYPAERQRLFCEWAAAAVGYDFTRGRLDPTTHPFFTPLGPDDCRITTRYNSRDFSEAFFGTLHEVGHAISEQGIEREHFSTPMGEIASLGIHESQARLWENTVGRGHAFWRCFFPLARSVFPEALGDVTLDEFHAAVNRVEPSLIRVGADEATYNLHILIRFELESALLSGDLAVADLPAAWNEAYRHYLGVTPTNDAEGCLQDGHWAAGMIGYFPTYTFGNVFAGQLYARAVQELGDLDEAFTRGDFAPLLHWLREKVHRQGSRYRAAKLIEVVTGSPPEPRALLEGLRRKYEQLYQLNTSP